MQRLFPSRDPADRNNHIQGRLMALAALVILSYGLILTLAPAVRFHAGTERYQYQHWIGVVAWGVIFSLLHNQTARKLPQRDPYLLPIISFLSGIGLMAIWRLFPSLGMRQTIWLGIAALLILLGIYFPGFLKYLRRYKYIWLIIGLFLTGLTIFMGTNPLGGESTRWLQFLGLHFQPSEPLKLLLIAFLAGYFTDQVLVSDRELEALLPTLAVTGIALLLLVFQGDLGTAAIFLLIYLAMLFTSGGNRSMLWIAPLVMIIAGVAGYLFTDVVRLRVDTWLNPFGDPTGTSYQIIQSMVAIAEGDLLGAGPGLGSPGLIPVAVSDFIFSALAEEIGFLGITAIILLYVILIFRGIKIAMGTNNSFHRYLTLGLSFYYGIQSILIIGGNIGLLPLTGVTLPFLSYGGSSLLVSFFGVLILLTISHQSAPESDPAALQQPRYALVGYFLIFALIVEIITVSLLSFWFNPSLVNRPENPRWIINDRFVKRGDIVDRDNQVIITSEGTIGDFTRTSNHVPLYPVIGFSHRVYGQTGIEASMFTYLRGHTGHPFSTNFWHKLLYNQPPEGLDIRLTLDLDLQASADALLEGHTGAVVVINANSGEILAMSSYPYFDATELETTWDELLTDENAPLLNRAAQGLYPPGGALFPFIMASDPESLLQSQDPEILFEDMFNNLECARPLEEPLTWQTVIANGCQQPQMRVAGELGVVLLQNTYQNFGFFSSPRFHLPVAEPSVPDPADLDAFYRGEGSFVISPLQMAMAASTIAHQGMLPGPRIVNAYQNPLDGWTTLPKLQVNADALPPASAQQVNQLLSLANAPYWQVLATVERENQPPVTWFVAGTSTDWQGQPMIVVVVLEQDSSILAEIIGRTLIESAIRFSSQPPTP
ncbi:MAG: FtsW/RodA/SpoVE family cell cycle protein [Brevefilum sp.]